MSPDRPLESERLEAHLVENEWGKGEWQSELDFAILERGWRR